MPLFHFFLNQMKEEKQHYNDYATIRIFISPQCVWWKQCCQAWRSTDIDVLGTNLVASLWHITHSSDYYSSSRIRLWFTSHTEPNEFTFYSKRLVCEEQTFGMNDWSIFLLYIFTSLYLGRYRKWLFIQLLEASKLLYKVKSFEIIIISYAKSSFLPIICWWFSLFHFCSLIFYEMVLL